MEKAVKSGHIDSLDVYSSIQPAAPSSSPLAISSSSSAPMAPSSSMPSSSQGVKRKAPSGTPSQAQYAFSCAYTGSYDDACVLGPHRTFHAHCLRRRLT